MANLIKDQLELGKVLVIIDKYVDKLTNGKTNTVYYFKDTKESYTWDEINSLYVFLSSTVSDIAEYTLASDFPIIGEEDTLYIVNSSSIYTYNEETTQYSTYGKVIPVAIQLANGKQIKYIHPSVPETNLISLNTIYTIGYDLLGSYIYSGNVKLYLDAGLIFICFGLSDDTKWEDFLGKYTPPNTSDDSNDVVVTITDNMITKIYDKNKNGIVDDSERLGGFAPSYYLDKINDKIKINNVTISTIDTNNIIFGLLYNSSHDELEVEELTYGTLLKEGLHYSVNGNNTSIDLTGWNVSIGMIFKFKLYKNIK